MNETLRLGQRPCRSRKRGPCPRQATGCASTALTLGKCLSQKGAAEGGSLNRQLSLQGTAQKAIQTFAPQPSARNRGARSVGGMGARAGNQRQNRRPTPSRYCRVAALGLAVTAVCDPGTCSSRFERRSRAPGKWRVVETGNYISQKVGRSRGHQESAPAWRRFPSAMGPVLGVSGCQEALAWSLQRRSPG